jgi:hypothetical protein
MENKLTIQDESFHPPTLEDPWWCETHWFSFDQPGANLSSTIYPFFRRNMNIASLAVYLWDDTAVEPWNVLYGRAYWHLPIPDTDLRELRIGGLEYDCIEPWGSYRVAYRDGERVEFELRFEGLREPHLAGKHEHGGHMDQPCKVTGYVQLPGRRVEIDCLGMRDKTWGPRPDTGSNRAGAYTYGTQSGDEQWLVLTASTGNEGTARPGTSGYLVRDGVKSGIVSAGRFVTRRTNGYPVELRMEATDELGRTLEATGRCINRFANQALAGTFAWMTMVQWQTADGKTFVGEDQEVWSPDLLGPNLQALNTTA